jgi:hypothetical protein
MSMAWANVKALALNRKRSSCCLRSTISQGSQPAFLIDPPFSLCKDLERNLLTRLRLKTNYEDVKVWW